MELKPCPCGSNAIERERHPNIFYRQKYTDRYPEPIASQLHGHRIRCEACGLQTCWWHLPEEADAAWNRRPLEDALSARVAELEAENARLRGWLERIDGGDDPSDNASQLTSWAYAALIGHAVPE